MNKYLVTFWVRNSYKENSRMVAIEVWADSKEDAELAVAKLKDLDRADFEALDEAF